MIKFPYRLPAITKNRYEILFFYEDPLLIDKKININLNNKKLNNQKLNNLKLNNKETISNNEVEKIESNIENILRDKSTHISIKEMLNKSNNQKKPVTIKNIGNINNKKNIKYLNNYNKYSRLACYKFYFHYRDETSLMKRLNGEKEFNYIYDEQSYFKKILAFLPKLFSKLITYKDIKLFNDNIDKLKLMFNNNINISKIKNLPEYKNLSNNEFEKKVEEEKKNIINNIRKYEKYKKSSDEEISKIILEMLNKYDTTKKVDVYKKTESVLNKNFVNLDNQEKENIKSILKLSKSNSGNIIKKSKKEYFESNINNAFNRIRKINPNVKYCLVLDIKKSRPYKLNSVGKEYNKQSGGRISYFAPILIIRAVLEPPIIVALSMALFFTCIGLPFICYLLWVILGEFDKKNN